MQRHHNWLLDWLAVTIRPGIVRLRGMLGRRLRNDDGLPRSNGTRLREHRRGLGPKSAPRPFALALQGGGAHGAFTWGVLERLLDERALEIEAVSGASAGALNAVALASGFLDGGPAGAKAKLAALWQEVVRIGRMNPLRPTPVERMAFGWNADGSASHLAIDLLARLISPYQFNPLGLHPLRDVLAKLIDFEALKQPKAIRLFVAATRIETGASRIFTNEEISADTILASACLPTVHQAVRLDDGHYWDGGFSANPPILPLVEQCAAADLLIVRLNPAYEESVPTTASEIQARINRIVFEAPLRRELDILAGLQRAALDAKGFGGPLAQHLATLRVHGIGADDVMRKLGTLSKLHPDRRLVRYLNETGYRAAEEWIARTAVPKRAPTPVSDSALGGGV